MDPIRTAVLNNRFAAVVEEASTAVYRTAHTTFVKLNQDYQCALATAEGDIFAYPNQSGVPVFIGISLRAVVEWVGAEKLEPGDVIMTNDPWTSEGLCSHIMDVHMLRPIFRNGRLLGIAWAFVHASDIGGAVPGSISPHLSEVFQEGIRMRPVKLYRRGELNREIRDIFLSNCRIPDEVWGDFKAMLSALNTMERRLLELCDRFGDAEIEQGMQDVMDFAEVKARRVIADIPDGEYRFNDYLEGLGDGEFIHMQTTLRIQGDTAEVDFTGTDPQVAAAYNIVSSDRLTHPYLTTALNYYILTRDPTTPKNAGLLRPIKMIAPKGTLVNGEFPCSGGSRAVTSTRAYDTLVGCLDQAVPDGIVSSGAGMAGIIVVNARDPLSGQRRVSVVNPICGGSGGRRNGDGVDGVDGRFGMLKSTPAETIEVETPLRVRTYGLLPDTYGAGRWRGGAAVVLDLENTDLEATITVRGMNRFHFRPWGFAGGQPGQLGQVVMNPGTAEERSIGKITVLPMKKGERVRMITPSGSGFGDPLEREPERVLADVVDGLLTPAKALADYGVAITGAGESSVVDAEATRQARGARRTGTATGLFAFGPERDAVDRIWPADVRAALAERVRVQDPAVRVHLMREVSRTLTRKGKRVTVADVEAALAHELAEIGRPSETTRSRTSAT